MTPDKLVCSCNLKSQYKVQYTNMSLHKQAKGEKVIPDNLSQKIKYARFMRTVQQRKPDITDNQNLQFRLL
jgi:hypothetical protein